MDTKDLIIGIAIGAAFVWLWTRQQQNQLNQQNQLRNYKNDETIVVLRDKLGFISRLKVERDAHEFR